MVKHMLDGISKRKQWGLWGILALLFLMVVFLTAVSYFYRSGEGVLAIFVRFHFEAMLLIALGGVFVGATGFSLLSTELKQTTQSLKENTQLLISFLTPEERACVNLLVEKQGKCYQHELSKLPGLSRLKAHRLVQRLEDRKLIIVHEMGKARELELNAALRAALIPQSNPSP
jgi:uncharacterized membrane protein